MKSVLLRKTATLLILATLTAASSFAQVKPHENPKYGKDSVTRMECIKNISLYSEFYKQKNYKDAVVAWKKVFDNCPKASKNTFLRGAIIYKNLIVKEKDKQKKDELIDLLLNIYDKRIETFGQKALVLGYKGLDIYVYRGKSAAGEAYKVLKESVELGKERTPSAIVSTLMQTVVDLYKDEKTQGDEVIEIYTLCMQTLDVAESYNKTKLNGKYHKNAEKELENIETSRNNVDALFSESGAANCDALSDIFSPKYDQNTENIDWLKKATKILNKYDCTDKEIFAKAAEQLYKLEPSAESAHNLARLFLKKNDYSKADKYYEEAAKLEEDSVTKALFYYEWSTLAMAQSNYPKVRNLSNSALKNNPKDGRPYLMIGKAYAASKGIGKEAVEHRSVYWVAVDKFIQAKNADPSIVEQANELINTYKKYYPNFEEWFMAVGSKEGDKYVVGGWINETTKVRF